MMDAIIESVVLSFCLGGFMGAIVALHFAARQKPTGQRTRKRGGSRYG